MITKNSTVVYSENGKQCLTLKYPNRQGVVLGQSVSKDCLMVLWEGRKTAESIHESFLSELTIKEKV